MHCMKSVQIRSFFWSVFSCIRTRKNSVFGHFSRRDELKQNYFMNTLSVSTSLCDSVTLREKCPNTYFHVFSPNIGKHGPEKTPHLDTFHSSSVNEPALVKTLFWKCFLTKQTYGKKRSRVMFNFPSKIFSSFSAENAGSYLYNGYAISHINT